MEILYILLGAILSIVTTIFIEEKRKPSLSLEIQANEEIANYPENTRPAKKAKFLYIDVRNQELPWALKWLTRNAAFQCHGTVTFHHLDGTRVFTNSMPIRWTSLPNPEGQASIIDNKVAVLYDINKINHDSRIDIYPGFKESINIAARFDDDEECYGWTNKNFFSAPMWRNPDWKLPNGRFLVKVVISSSVVKCEGIFRLVNDVGMKDFRLEKALEEDKIYHS
jgi:hypothetical protein